MGFFGAFKRDLYYEMYLKREDRTRRMGYRRKFVDSVDLVLNLKSVMLSVKKEESFCRKKFKAKIDAILMKMDKRRFTHFFTFNESKHIEVLGTI